MTEVRIPASAIKGRGAATALAHRFERHARAAFDVTFDFGGTLGFQEIEGVHNRGDFDLSQHQQFSNKKLEYYDQLATPGPERDVDVEMAVFAAASASEPGRVNLGALSLLSLLVGAFLVHETMRLSVTARRTSFGVLRALGVNSRTQAVLAVSHAGQPCSLYVKA